jgi:hypothetical protein
VPGLANVDDHRVAAPNVDLLAVYADGLPRTVEFGRRTILVQPLFVKILDRSHS